MDGILGVSISNATMLSAWENEWVDIPKNGEEFWEKLQEKIRTSRIKDSAEVIFDSAGYRGVKQ
ncbi:MAG: hypothetical protein E7604_09420 [Ruminococcaceae bacterium]|nr:hypothetical protein [Oscillospiraceae bacterium]